MEASGKAELEPDPVPSRVARTPRATSRRRRFGVFLVLAVAGLLAPAFVTVPVRLFASHGQRLVSGALPGIQDGEDRVTALAWTPAPDGSLIVGTQQGRVYSVTRGGLVTTIPSEPGTIVALAPDRTGSGTRIVMRGGLGSTDAPLLYRVGGTDENLSFADAALALQLGSSGGHGIGPDVARWKEAVEREAGSKISVAAAFPDGTLSGDPALGDSRQASGLEAIVRSGASRPVVVGFADGRVRIPGNPVLEGTGLVGHAARGPVLALTIDTSPTGPALIAAALADGSAALVMVGLPEGASSKLLARSIGRPCRQAVPDSPSRTSGTRPERLFLSWASGILVSHCTDGGVAVTRFPISLAEGEIISDRLPLPDLVTDRPPLGVVGTVVSEAQRTLAVAGYNPGDADGVLGTRTMGALDQFRQARGLANAADSKVLDALLGATWRVSAVAFSPAADVLAVAGNDGIIRVTTLSPTPGSSLRVSGHADIVTHLEISPDGRVLASAGLDGRLWMTDLGAARTRAGLPFSELPTGPARFELKPVPLDGLDESQETPPQGISPQGARPQNLGGQGSGPPEAAGDLIVVFGGDTTLAAAQAEVVRAAQAGIAGAEIVFREGSYRSIVRYPDRATRQRGLAQLRSLSVWSAGAYGRNFSAWCPNPVRRDGYMRCGEPGASSRAD